MKKIYTLAILFILCVSVLWAGDAAVFVDLGFSPDGRTYMFGQHGVQAQSLRPWAELYIVDVAANNFVPNGRISHTHDSPIKAGQDGSGVFYRLLTANANLTRLHGIDYMHQGLPLYISRNENPPLRGETITFRDFASGVSYTAQLVPTITGTGQNTRSSFVIRLESRSGSGTRTYTVGTPQMIRPLISSYNIKRVLIDPTGRSLVFVIEMRRVTAAGTGFDIRYMVETLRL